VLLRDQSGLKATLDELFALRTRDASRELDLFHRQGTMIAKRTADLTGSTSRHHIEYILPSDQGFLVHLRESFRFDPFEQQPS
jgi:hypothetical protein